MKTYKVSIQITQVDENKGHYLDLGPPYEAGTFETEIEARKLVENELMIIRPMNIKLQQACRQVLDGLDAGGEQSRAFAEEIRILKDALEAAPTVKADCPRCGAGSDEREFTRKELIGTGAIHMHYVCKKCDCEIIAEFTLTDVFIDSGQ